MGRGNEPYRTLICLVNPQLPIVENHWSREKYFIYFLFFQKFVQFDIFIKQHNKQFDLIDTQIEASGQFKGQALDQSAYLG